MQHDFKNYDPEKHDRYRALSVQQPYAFYIQDGLKTIEVRTRPIKYRGDVLICASAKPIRKDFAGFPLACTIAIAELYDIKPLKDFTEEDWLRTCIPSKEYEKYRGFGWLLRNIRPVVELPIKGQLGLFNAVFDKDEIQFYHLGEKSPFSARKYDKSKFKL